MGGIGGTIGGILGATVGSVIPGVGTTIGASVGTGLGQLIEGRGQKKKAQGMTPSPVSPLDQSMYNILKRRQQKIATGTEYNPQIVAGQQLAKTMQRNAMNAGATPNMGLYNQMISQTMQNIQEMTSRDIAQTTAQLGEQTARNADISRDIKLLERNEKMADASQNIKDSGQNLAAALQPKGDFTYNELGETPEEARKRKATEAKLQKEQKDQES
jgi:hypothetical protein